MRKFSIIGSLLAVSMLTIGVTAANAEAPTGTFTAKISPNVTNKRIGNLTLGGTINPLTGVPVMRPIPKLLEITLPNAKVDKRALSGTDKKADIEASGKCSKSSYRLGTLKVTAHAVPLIETLNTSGEVCIVQTNPGSVLSVVLAVVYDPLGIRLAIPAEVKLSGGHVVISVDTGILNNLVAGQSVSVSAISATINRNPNKKIKGKRISLLTTPKRCINKKWEASQTTTFFDADPLTVTTTTRCKQAKKK